MMLTALFFCLIILFAGMAGAKYMFDMSNENEGDASIFYGIAGAIWAIACLIMIGVISNKALAL